MEKLKAAYKIWQSFLPHLPKTARYTIGLRCELSIIEAVEATLIATFLEKTEKLPFVRKAGAKVDLAQFFLQTMWETSILDDKKFAHISQPLVEAGKMLSGWIGQLKKQNSPTKIGEK